MTKNKLNVTARWLMFLIAPEFPDLYSARMGFQTNEPSVKAIGDFTIIECKDIKHTIERAEKLAQSLGVPFDKEFTLVYPPFKGKTPEKETFIIDTAWAINEQAMERDWLFSRAIPQPLF